jgi:hypothetical protein
VFNAVLNGLKFLRGKTNGKNEQDERNKKKKEKKKSARGAVNYRFHLFYLCGVLVSMRKFILTFPV